MARITIEDCTRQENNRFALVLMAAIRAKQLMRGARALVQRLVDRGVRAGPLQCFPAAGDPNTWYYVPQTARLVTGEDGKPAFSYLRFEHGTVGVMHTSRAMNLSTAALQAAKLDRRSTLLMRARSSRRSKGLVT